MLDRTQTALVVIDFQEKLLPKIARQEDLVPRALRLIQAARLLDVPVLWTEQYPRGLGRTVDAVARVLDGVTPTEKTAFGCLGSAAFQSALGSVARRQLLVTGIETHVCVLQTALGALEQGYEVYVARDAAGARCTDEHEAALARLAAAGVILVTSEMAIFELLQDAAAPEFKELLPLLK